MAAQQKRPRVIVEPDQATVSDRRPIVKFVKISNKAYTPTKGSTFAAGHDLYSAYDYVVLPGDRAVVYTDIMVQLPTDCYGRIAPRSGLALKYGLHPLGGVVDCDYRGNVTVILANLSSRVHFIKRGDRIAQIILTKIHNPHFLECESLTQTDRGARGFGSSGMGSKTTGSS